MLVKLLVWYKIIVYLYRHLYNLTKDYADTWTQSRPTQKTENIVL